MSESVFCHFFKKLEFVRIGVCQNWNLSELEFIRIGNCQNWKLSELEFVRIGICPDPELSKLLKGPKATQLQQFMVLQGKKGSTR